MPVTTAPTPISSRNLYPPKSAPRKKEAMSEMNISPIKKTLFLKNSRSALGSTLVSSAMLEIMSKRRGTPS